ncbi:hypothetical protein [Pseudomonas shirazensis]|uniref:hypothetical protein n=1 Tax=Pseudomonas shirazensis TaxID=2745494 RepID=UPI003D27F42E
MFDPRHDPSIIQDGNGLTLQEELEIECAKLKRMMTLGTPENVIYERQLIDDLAAWIENNSLDVIDLDEDKDVFRFNALIHVRDSHRNAKLIKDRVKVAAANQVWHKFNH